jgi:hypothetical protein
MKFLFATGRDRKALAESTENTRARVAFYASTPAYRPAFEIHGLGDLADRLKAYSKAQRWEEMPPFITDDILDTFAVVGTYDEIGHRIVERFGDWVTGIEFSIGLKDKDDERQLLGIVDAVRGSDRPAGLQRALGLD